ncbi:MAG: ABC transporter ATP-binding protein [Oscillospiraceae bacterium]|nr:ABC transporter ATP-binding protein [Oscillospiraceae bacterium]MBR6207995.1 ABC transporter ATP-binding protein [Oscillospiraceae bacterium]
MQYQVELCEIVKDYKSFRAVDHISLGVQKGEIISLLGASGCGKTTTLRMIAGLIPPTEGSIKFEGIDVTNVPPYKRDVAMVFQNYALFPHMTVFENVVYGLRNRKIRDKAVLREKAEEMLSIVQLEGSESKYPRQLSGGQQQRVSLARALIVNPKIMLFDEPLSNLDAKLRVQTRTEIRNLLKQMNITALYVTHDQEEALSISDQIAVMNRGRIEQLSKPTELYNHPKTKFVADFIGQANLFDGVVEQAPDDELCLALENGVHLHCSSASETAANGEKKSVLIRPESITVSNQMLQTDNVFPARIVESSFLGSVIRYKMMLDNGLPIKAELRPGNALPSESGQVYVGFDREYAILVD